MTISYTITSSTGEDHHADVDVTKALADIQKTVEKESKWLFIDGRHTDATTLSPDELAKGKVIMLTDVLMGG